MAARRRPAGLLFAAAGLAQLGPSGATAAAAAAAQDSVDVADLAQKWSLWPLGGGEEEHYDCTHNDKASVAGWPDAQLRWCCKRDGGLLCPPDDEGSGSKSSEPRGDQQSNFDCSTTPAGWSRAKQDHCCTHEMRGCPNADQPRHADQPEHRYDCVAGFAHWRTVWSEAKRKDCCVRFERGCPEKQEAKTTTGGPPTTTQRFDCEADKDNWQSGWSAHKREWCCQSVSRGCAHHEQQQHDSDSTASGASEKESHLIDSSETHYDCLSDAWNWVKAWSSSKKSWCCTKHGLGCTSAAEESSTSADDSEPVSFDCDVEFSSWETSWSSIKKEWCCKKKDRGCRRKGKSSSTSVEATTRTTTSRPSTSSAASKAEEPEPESEPVAVGRTTSLPYDCDHLFVSWKSSWSDGKKAWCCLRNRRGCPSDYDCDEGYSHWQSEWSTGQKKYCCKHQHRGCDGDKGGKRKGDYDDDFGGGKGDFKGDFHKGGYGKGGFGGGGGKGDFGGKGKKGLSAPNPEDRGRLVYAGNLPFRTAWQDLKDVFKEYGDVIRVEIAQDIDGRSRGFGMVLFDKEEGAEAAINALNETEFQGRTMAVRMDQFI